MLKSMTRRSAFGSIFVAVIGVGFPALRELACDDAPNLRLLSPAAPESPAPRYTLQLLAESSQRFRGADAAPCLSRCTPDEPADCWREAVPTVGPVDGQDIR